MYTLSLLDNRYKQIQIQAISISSTMEGLGEQHARFKE